MKYNHEKCCLKVKVTDNVTVSTQVSRIDLIALLVYKKKKMYKRVRQEAGSCVVLRVK